MWIWLITLLKGFLPIDGKRVGKIIWVLVLCAVAIGAYHKLFVQKSTKIEKIENYYACPEDKSLAKAEIKIWKLKLSLGF